MTAFIFDDYGVHNTSCICRNCTKNRLFTVRYGSDTASVFSVFSVFSTTDVTVTLPGAKPGGHIYQQMPPMLVCECGADKINAPFHSDWCPKYNQERK